MPEQQGTGKHPHKSTEEPYPHHESSASGGKKDSGKSENRQAGSQPQNESRDLKEREYKDKDGNIHHHTHTSGAMKDK
jgi:hypothetical protein